MEAPGGRRWAPGAAALAFSTGSLFFCVLVRVMTGTSWPNAIAFGVPTGLFLGSFCYSSRYVARATPIAGTGFPRIIVTTIGAALVSAAVWVTACRVWWDALTWLGWRLGDGAERPGVLLMLAGFAFLVDLIAIAAWYVAQAYGDSVAERRRALEAEVAQRDAEVRALRAQVDPHFLFNSLNSIAGLIAPDPAKARVMCQMLADFLRDSLSLGRAARIPLEREVALAEQYLRVERVRFGTRLSVTTHVSAESAPVPVPPLILQPLVENAVRHGIATLIDGGTIEIEARVAGTRAVVVVTNPRDDTASRKGTGFGMDIVRRRLAATFGDRASLTIEPLPDRFQVSLTIPVEEGA